MHQMSANNFESVLLDEKTQLPDKTPTGKNIQDWLSFHDRLVIIPIIDGSPDDSNYFCTYCGVWNIFGGKIFNINEHLFTLKHKRSTVLHDINSRNLYQAGDEETKIAFHIENFILRNGLSFSLIEDEDLNKLTSQLPKRQTLSMMATNISDIIKKRITELLSNSRGIVLIFDEWTNKNNVRYLGSAVQCLIDGKVQGFILSFKNLSDAIVDANVLKREITDIINFYHINGRVSRIITDSASAMRKAVESSLTKWSPCIAHQENLIIGKTINLLGEFIKPLQDFQASVSHSVRFSNFLEARGATFCTIQSYTPTRWYSMCGMIHVFAALHNEIALFCAEKQWHIQLTNFNFNSAIFLDPIFQLFTDVMEHLESDSFGSLSRSIFLLSVLSIAVPTHLSIIPEFAKVIPSYRDIVDEQIQNVKGSWGRILYAAAILNPAPEIQSSLSDEERELGKEFILQQRFPAIIENPNQQRPLTPQTSPLPQSTILATYQQRIRDSVSNSLESQLNSYLGMVEARPFVVDDLEAFWESNRLRWPQLYSVAIEILSIPGSSTRIERLFSKSRRMFGDSRFRLSPKKSEANCIIIGNPEIFHSVRSGEPT